MNKGYALDNNQKDAVICNDKNVLVVAAPGAGYHYFSV